MAAAGRASGGASASTDTTHNVHPSAGVAKRSSENPQPAIEPGAAVQARTAASAASDRSKANGAVAFGAIASLAPARGPRAIALLLEVDIGAHLDPLRLGHAHRAESFARHSRQTFEQSRRGPALLRELDDRAFGNAGATPRLGDRIVEPTDRVHQTALERLLPHPHAALGDGLDLGGVEASSLADLGLEDLVRRAHRGIRGGLRARVPILAHREAAHVRAALERFLAHAVLAIPALERRLHIEHADRAGAREAVGVDAVRGERDVVAPARGD